MERIHWQAEWHIHRQNANDYAPCTHLENLKNDETFLIRSFVRSYVWARVTSYKEATLPDKI